MRTELLDVWLGDNGLTDRHGAIFLPISELLGHRNLGASTLLRPLIRRDDRSRGRRGVDENTIRQPCVLLVDDHPTHAKCTAYLNTQVLRCPAATASRRSGGCQIGSDIILMDPWLPVMDGWEATRQLKADPHDNIPVVAQRTVARNADGAKEVGCEAFLTKPCLPEDLVQEIRRVLA